MNTPFQKGDTVRRKDEYWDDNWENCAKRAALDLSLPYYTVTSSASDDVGPWLSLKEAIPMFKFDAERFELVKSISLENE